MKKSSLRCPLDSLPLLRSATSYAQYSASLLHSMTLKPLSYLFRNIAMESPASMGTYIPDAKGQCEGDQRFPNPFCRRQQCHVVFRCQDAWLSYFVKDGYGNRVFMTKVTGSIL